MNETAASTREEESERERKREKERICEGICIHADHIHIHIPHTHFTFPLCEMTDVISAWCLNLPGDAPS